jgi:hypothetical protein
LAETFSVTIQLEKFVLIARIFFFILSPLSFLGLLGIRKIKKKTQEKKSPLMLLYQVFIGFKILAKYRLQFFNESKSR